MCVRAAMEGRESPSAVTHGSLCHNRSAHTRHVLKPGRLRGICPDPTLTPPDPGYVRPRSEIPRGPRSHRRGRGTYGISRSLIPGVLRRGRDPRLKVIPTPMLTPVS